jgi:O-acetyl-ADP-ribose deacetylase
MKTALMDQWLWVWVGNIVDAKADVIVNAANESLLGGGGVDGAIHRAGGPEILQECKALRETKYPDGLPVGDAVATSAGLLQARYVIHTVGPVYGLCNGKEPDLLRSCYWNSLMLAKDLGASSIVFPAISTGAYRYPLDKATRVFADTLRDIRPAVPSIQRIEVVLFSEANLQIFLSAFPSS